MSLPLLLSPYPSSAPSCPLFLSYFFLPPHLLSRVSHPVTPNLSPSPSLSFSLLYPLLSTPFLFFFFHFTPLAPYLSLTLLAPPNISPLASLLSCTTPPSLLLHHFLAPPTHTPSLLDLCPPSLAVLSLSPLSFVTIYGLLPLYLSISVSFLLSICILFLTLPLSLRGGDLLRTELLPGSHSNTLYSAHGCS